MTTKIKTPEQIAAAEKAKQARAARKAAAAASNTQPNAGEKGGADNGKATKQGAASAAPEAIIAVVLDHLNHDGQVLEPGDTVELSQDDFDALKSLGVVEEI